MVATITVGVGVASLLVLQAFQSNLLYFISPSEVVAGNAPENQAFRLGGLVVEGSIDRPGDGLTVQFEITDTAKVVPVEYTGILPDLFREGQGIVAKGKLNSNGVFEASEVLAKHDENYMPPEAAEAIQAAQTLVQE